MFKIGESEKGSTEYFAIILQLFYKLEIISTKVVLKSGL